MRSTYQDTYTWDNYLSIDGYDFHALEHSDGAVSVAFVWNGYSTELKTDGKVQGIYREYFRALQSISKSDRIVVENHFLRTYDTSVSQKYLEYGEKNIVRFKELGMKFREDIANTISDFSMSNDILCVMTMRRSISPLATFRPKKHIKRTMGNAQKLAEIALDFAANLPGSKFLSTEELERFIWKHYHRDRGRSNKLPPSNPRFKLAHRVAQKPTYENGVLVLGDTYTKVALLLDYPDAKLNWFYAWASQCGCEFEVTQIIVPTAATRELTSSARQTERSLESANAVGGESERGKVSDHNAFREYVADNNLAIFNNCYIIKFHHVDVDQLREVYRAFKNTTDESVVLADDSEELALLYWRVSQIGQGHRSPFLRPDHTWQVGNMAPIIKFNEGDKECPQMLRITSDAQAVTLGFPFDGTNHTVTAAKTGGGKGVNTAAQITELFPLGVNFYIAEVGPTYKTLVEMFGGTYFDLDPNTTVVSPFPDYSLASSDSKNPLDADIVAPTIGALMPLFARNRDKDIAQHIQSVAEQMMQAMYAFHDPEPGLKAPTLATYYEFADEVKGEFDGVQAKAANAIVENMNSFLGSTAGSNFNRADTLNFDSGIVGVNFKPLMGNEELAKFMLVFIALRYKQLAFANSTPTRIILDEQHEFNRIDEELIKTLAKQLTRMGRKEAGAYQGISQEVMDMGLEPGILNQITHREFMYTQDGHDQIAKLFSINDNAKSRWKSYPDPEAAGSRMNYRQCLRMVGDDVFDLHLKFPQSLLDVANSSPSGLKIKEQLRGKTKDPIQFLEILREALSK